MSHIDRDEVLARLTASDVADAYGLAGRWSGSWMRSKRCPQVTHGTDAFGLSREGKWHCHSCDNGGDILALIAAAEGLDVHTQFGTVLEVAAAIAGVEPEADWGETPAPLRKPVKRTPEPSIPPLGERLARARARCEWVWSHLTSPDSIKRVIDTGRHVYLETRGLRWREIPDHARINVRDLIFWAEPADYQELIRITGEDAIPKADRGIARAIHRIYSSAPGVAIAVRHIETGNLVDVRTRRAEVPDGEPKILGMTGGVAVHARLGGSDLVGCYGNPHALDRELVIVVEGWADYLTAAWRWPKADVLGAVDAGQYPLVAGFAARYLAERGGGRLVLVAQDDGDDKAADRAVNAASKRAITLLGPESVGWIEARAFGVKDLNDIARAGRMGELKDNP